MEGRLSTLVINWINFAIILGLLRHFFWDKLKGIIAQRQKYIDDKLIKADEDAEKARMYLVQNEQILQSAKDEGKKITEEHKQKGEKLYDEIVGDAKVEAVSLKERASMEIEREKQKAEHEIKKQAVDLAVELSVKALGQQIDEATHRKLIGDFIAKVGM
ncbi:F0F1 ATP synthase subunit B [Clostridium sp.]|uniref:F0F1 ATP synthase subunit B n=1 Tax=Clostridium sp. TaxID=1506 RepID=UPI0028510DC3|nr:F0F1 ATP synthase subunit B [Clostridium sp.]MDR3595493.1 F0F1 ATP synthase subunit B [Clostridium sp.]